MIWSQIWEELPCCVCFPWMLWRSYASRLEDRKCAPWLTGHARWVICGITQRHLLYPPRGLLPRHPAAHGQLMLGRERRRLSVIATVAGAPLEEVQQAMRRPAQQRMAADGEAAAPSGSTPQA